MNPVSEPSDGWDGLEKLLLREIVLKMYNMVVDPVMGLDPKDKGSVYEYQQAMRRMQNAFIIMAINELGYTQHEVGRILNISQVAVRKRLLNTHEKIRKTEGYK